MFTGIVQTKGRVASVTPQPGGARLVIDRLGWSPSHLTFSLGDSVCVSGVCLTLAAFDAQALSFDVIPETLAKTTLGGLVPGADVNLEPSLTATTQIGGHFVQGHVDGVGDIVRVLSTPQEWRLAVRPPKDLLDYIILKGSITLDGVSLTLAHVASDTFEVALIPTTLAITTLAQRKAGDRLNIECDILSKTIVSFLRRQRGSAERSEGDGGW